MNRVVLIELPVFDVITDGTGRTGLDFEDERVALLINVPAIDL